MVERGERLLRVLLHRRGWNRYGIFCAEYDRAAHQVDSALVGSAPSRAQLHRWTEGGTRGLPYPHHCRALEAMFPGWNARELFETAPADLPADRTAMTQGLGLDGSPTVRVVDPDAPPSTVPGKFADLQAVYTSRTEFTAELSPAGLFDPASSIRMVGLSLNILCQHYPDQKLRRLIEDGTTVTCLFLDPKGKAIRARALEESLPEEHLAYLTDVNIEIMKRLRRKLSSDGQQRFTVAVYDEVPRFNITLIDDDLCIVQPYLLDTRGLDSPTFLIDRQGDNVGLYPVFEQTYLTLLDRSTLL